MKLQGGYTFDAGIETVWAHIFAEDAFARLIPGCKNMVSTAPGEYEGLIAVNMGPIKNDFSVCFKLRDQAPPRSCRFEGRAEGQMGGGAGNSLFTLEECEGKTKLQYEAALTLTGHLNKIGPRYVESAVKSMIQLGMQKMEEEIKTADLFGGQVDAPKKHRLRDFFRLIILFVKGLKRN